MAMVLLVMVVWFAASFLVSFVACGGPIFILVAMYVPSNREISPEDPVPPEPSTCKYWQSFR